MFEWGYNVLNLACLSVSLLLRRLVFAVRLWALWSSVSSSVDDSRKDTFVEQDLIISSRR